MMLCSPQQTEPQTFGLHDVVYRWAADSLLVYIHWKSSKKLAFRKENNTCFIELTSAFLLVSW